MTMSAIERAAHAAWAAWGSYGKNTICAACGDPGYCRAIRSRGPFICLGCYDQGRRS